MLYFWRLFKGLSAEMAGTVPSTGLILVIVETVRQIGIVMELLKGTLSGVVVAIRGY